jgi:putative hydrolase of the HAD superfamily
LHHQQCHEAKQGNQSSSSKATVHGRLDVASCANVQVFVRSNPPMTNVIIFDLDSCLSAADEIGRDLYRPAFEAIRQANRGTVSEEVLNAAFEDAWRIPFDIIAKTHGFSSEMFQAGWNAFTQITVTKPMLGYGDLHVLGEISSAKYLVTSGFRRLQESKVEMLGIRSWFEEILIDAIDEPGRRHKEGFFKRILDTRRIPPGEALVVGDNPDSEIAAGNRLGIPTVQILRPGVTRDDRALHHIHGLRELQALL